jgi:caa(3)-type oxidase subunit IV
MEHPPEPAHAPDHGVADHDAHHINTHVKGYVMVGLLLAFCTVLTVGLSYVNFGTPSANIIVAMILATFKVGCVAAIFMHLKSEKWTIYRILLITVLFAIGLFALTGLAFHDPIRL